ncbi:MAG TPA: hypothetical protein QGF58_00505 [Myxococcota bacterium]|nr:hypothetical protein [Myxococcota bacterium]
MRYSLPVLLLLSACGPDSEQLERIVRLEAAVEALQVEVGELQQDAEKQQEAAEGPVKCAQAKKVAFDAWEAVRVVAAGTVAYYRQICDDNGWGAPECDVVIGYLGHWQSALAAASGAKQSSVGGAIKAKEAADYAATFHDAEKLDTTAASGASATAWEACKGVDP